MRSSFIRLINVYTAILATTVILATAIFVWSNMRNYQSEVKQAETTITTQLSEAVTHHQQVAGEFATKLTTDPDYLQNINKYFSSSLADYSAYLNLILGLIVAPSLFFLVTGKMIDQSIKRNLVRMTD